MMRGGLFRFQFAANQTPTTFVCHPSKLMNYVDVPTYLAAPDFGTAYITRTGDAAAFYRRPSSLFPATSYAVDITPHQPASEDGLNEIGPQPWHTTLHFEVKSIEPLPELLSRDPRLARFPKYSLDMVQWRPDTGMVSNSVMSINCALAMLFYAEQAVWAPHLEDGISPMELVGASVDQYFKGARGYMMPNVNVVFAGVEVVARDSRLPGDLGLVRHPHHWRHAAGARVAEADGGGDEPYRGALQQRRAGGRAGQGVVRRV